MKVCIYGAGAIGGHIAARLIADTDAEVSIVARGAHLAAIRESGIRLRSGGQECGGRPHAATDDPASLPPQDIILVTLKGPSLTAAARPLARLLGETGFAVFLMNGIPWWWSHGTGHDGPLDLVDPGAVMWREVGPRRALHGVISSSNAIVAPGVIQHNGGNRWMIGEPDGLRSTRVEAVVKLFQDAGLHALVSGDIRADIWRKIFVNISSNPFAALTRLTSREGAAVRGLDDLCVRAIDEALAVALATGCDLRGETNAEDIVRPPGGRGGGRSSMLQDVDAGRALEVEGIVGQVRAFGRAFGAPTPTLDVVLPLLRGLDLALRNGREAAGRQGA